MPAFLPQDRPYIVAEIGGNHGGDLATAKEYLEAAAESGADAAKFQLYRAESLIVPDEPPLPLAGSDYETQFERFKELELTDDEWAKLADTAADLDVDFAASVFSSEFLPFVTERSPFIKLASGDLTNAPLLRAAADTGEPVVLSTAFATMDEIRAAYQELSESEVVLLHCMGSYPTDDGDANLQMIERLAAEFDCPVGYSDHTVGTRAPIVSAAFGARFIETHFTLDKSNPVGDHRLSATPSELETIVSETERDFALRGHANRESVYEAEREIKTQMRRSLATARAVSAGDRLTEADLTALRPERGISPMQIDDVVGRRVNQDLDAGTIIEESDLETT